MGILLCLLLGVVFIITFIVCVIWFVICVVEVKYFVNFLHHILYIQQLSITFQFLPQDVLNFVVIVSIVDDDLVEAGL